MKEAKCARLENGSGEELRYKQAERNRMMKTVMVGAKAGELRVVMEESRVGLRSWSVTVV